MFKFSPRFFLLPLLALVVIGSLPAPADSRAEIRGSGCGPAITNILDPDLRAEFASVDRSHSAAAAKICAIYRNSFEAATPH